MLGQKLEHEVKLDETSGDVVRLSPMNACFWVTNACLSLDRNDAAKILKLKTLSNACTLRYI